MFLNIFLYDWVHSFVFVQTRVKTATNVLLKKKKKLICLLNIYILQAFNEIYCPRPLIVFLILLAMPLLDGWYHNYNYYYRTRIKSTWAASPHVSVYRSTRVIAFYTYIFTFPMSLVLQSAPMVYVIIYIYIWHTYRHISL